MSSNEQPHLLYVLGIIALYKESGSAQRIVYECGTCSYTLIEVSVSISRKNDSDSRAS